MVTEKFGSACSIAACIHVESAASCSLARILPLDCQRSRAQWGSLGRPIRSTVALGGNWV